MEPRGVKTTHGSYPPHGAKTTCSVIPIYHAGKHRGESTIIPSKEKPIIQDPINLGNFIFKNKVLKKIHTSKSWINFLNRSSKNKISIFITKKKYFTFDSPREYNEIKTTFI